MGFEPQVWGTTKDAITTRLSLEPQPSPILSQVTPQVQEYNINRDWDATMQHMELLPTDGLSNTHQHNTRVDNNYKAISLKKTVLIFNTTFLWGIEGIQSHYIVLCIVKYKSKYHA